MAGSPPDVLVGSSEGTEYAVCFECAGVINDVPQSPELADALGVKVVCNHHAAERGIPPTLPGEYDFYDRHGKLLMETPDGRKRPQ